MKIRHLSKFPTFSMPAYLPPASCSIEMHSKLCTPLPSFDTLSSMLTRPPSSAIPVLVSVALKCPHLRHTCTCFYGIEVSRAPHTCTCFYNIEVSPCVKKIPRDILMSVARATLYIWSLAPTQIAHRPHGHYPTAKHGHNNPLVQKISFPYVHTRARSTPHHSPFYGTFWLA